MDSQLQINDFINSFCEEEDAVLQKLRRETILTQLHPRMLSSWHQISLLRFLIKVLGAKKILEIGTFTAYSAIGMAGAIPKGGEIISIEINDELEDIIRKYVEYSDYKDIIKVIIGDAKEIIPKLECEFDFVFIDADKREYCEYFEIVTPKLRKGGLIVVDNVIWDNKIFSVPASNDYMTQGIIRFNNMIRDNQEYEKVVLPLRDGLMLLRKL